VRIQLATTLAKVNSNDAVGLLCDLINAENHHLAVAPIIAAASSIQDIRIRNILKKQIGDNNNLILRKARALEGIGTQRHPDDFELLKAEVLNTQNNFLVHAASLRAVSKYRTLDAHKFLIERVNYGADMDETRYIAVMGLADVVHIFFYTK
jgi:hypothetical protein